MILNVFPQYSLNETVANSLVKLFKFSQSFQIKTTNHGSQGNVSLSRYQILHSSNEINLNSALRLLKQLRCNKTQFVMEGPLNVSHKTFSLNCKFVLYCICIYSEIHCRQYLDKTQQMILLGVRFHLVGKRVCIRLIV